MSELFYQMALASVPHVGSVLAKNLIAYAGSCEAVFKQSLNQLRHVPGIGPRTAHSIRSFDLNTIESLYTATLSADIQPIFFHSPSYPYRLKEIPDAPLLLYRQGTASLSESRMLGMVGMRKMTAYGRNFIERFLQELAPHGVTTVSGLALGVDQQVHRSSLEHNIPTLAVLGHGLQQIYPARHRTLARQIKEEGALLTEFPLGASPAPENFPKRNRIIAGLVDVVLVIESAEKGGSLITASLANQYNRDVMAVPGAVNSASSAGCNRLIKTHAAHLLETVDDLLRLMNWEGATSPMQQVPALTPEAHALLLKIKASGVVHINTLLADPDLEVAKISQRLLELELKKCISSLPGNRFQAH